MKKSSVLTLTKGVVFSYLISGICLLILAFLLFQFELPEGVSVVDSERGVSIDIERIY